jgi:hypothetical protein
MSSIMSIPEQASLRDVVGHFLDHSASYTEQIIQLEMMSEASE